MSKLEQLCGYGSTGHLYEELARSCRQRGCLVLRLGGDRHHDGRTECDGLIGAGVSTLRPQKHTRLLPPRDGVTVPFSRSRALDIVEDEHGNHLEQCQLDVKTLSAKEPLGKLFDYWRLLRATTRCRVTDIDTVRIMRAGLIGRVHLVDVTSNDPADFRYEIFAYGLPTDPIERPRSFPIKMFADNTLRNYNTVRLTAVPRLQRIRARFKTISYHYTRLILPFLDARQKVSHLAIAIRREVGDGAKVER